MNIEEFVNDYLQDHRHDVLLSPYNGLMEFALLVCQWQKEQTTKLTPEGLDEAAFKYSSGSPFFNTEYSAFKAGAEWQKSQMMKEAVEGEVKDFRFIREVNYASAKIEFDSIPDLKEGDKVRVIVIPKEDKK